MKTINKDVIAVLNDVLCAELTAINQYFLHSEICADWGYERLHKHIRMESIDEMKHAEQLIERVLYLNGLPNVQKLGKINIGENVHEMLQADVQLEYDALPRLNKGIEVCAAAGDNGSRLLLEEILAAEEEHVDWLESQLDQIEQVGIQNYCAAQIKEEK